MNIHRRHWLQSHLGSAALAAFSTTGLLACKGREDSAAAPSPAPTATPVPTPAPVATQPSNQYRQTNLVANKPSYQALFTDPAFVNAWGIAIRPQGAGGHFWVGAGGTSWQYVGDVASAPDAKLHKLFQDDLKAVTVAGADSKTDDSSAGKMTGVVFNGAPLESELFRVSKQVAGRVSEPTRFDGSARFVFVTDSGKVTAWTDRAKDGSIVRKDGPTQLVYNGAAQGSAFFGVAIKTGTWDRLWLADFGAKPQIVTLGPDFKRLPTQGFANPFATGAGGKAKPGDPVPFNIQVLSSNGQDRVFVAYAISQGDPQNSAQFFAAEEDALDAQAEAQSGNKPNKGKLVEFDLQGQVVKIYEDAQRLNAPWGLAIAPYNFGALSGKLLVGNFGGAGRICAFDLATGQYVDDLRDAADQPVAIPGLWGLQFGNGESLGDANALYFAAGPEDEVDGLFGSLRPVS
jgi:uncharacterized protein (TIGR03118 family)